MISRRFFLLPFVIGLFVVGCSNKSTHEFEGRSFIATAFDEVNTDEGESWVTFNAENNRMVFGRHAVGGSNHTLFESTQNEMGEWSEPTVMSFSGTYNDQGARFYPALDAMLFSSDRPTSPDDQTNDFNLWIAMNDGESWLEPEALSALNTDADEFHGSVAADGSIYFASNRPGGKGKSDIYRAVLGREGYVVAPLQGMLNSEYSESDVFVDEESRFLIVTRTDDPNGIGGDDLWISFPSADGWGEAVNLGPEVNTTEHEHGAVVNMSRNLLFFTSQQHSQADVYTIGMGQLVVDWPTN